MKKSLLLSIGTLIFLSGQITSPASAHGLHSPGIPHEHGAGGLLIRLEGDTLFAQLSAPRANFKAEGDVLAPVSEWLTFNSEAGCTLTLEDENAYERHDPPFDKEPGHSDMLITFGGHCDTPDALTSITASFLAEAADFSKLKTILITEKGAATAMLGPDNLTIERR